MKNLFNFIDNAVSPFHAVAIIKRTLEEKGFIGLNEGDKFNLEAGKSYFVIRNDASVIAFKMPKKAVDHFKIVASHLDSPTFKLKPNSQMENTGLDLLNTEIYGGPILSTWFDRPLGIAGRVMIKDGNNLTTKLVKFDNACVIPNIAIHLNRDVNNGYKYNPQVDTLPIFGQKRNFMEFLLKELKIEKENLKAFDLTLFNEDKGRVVGINDDFFTSPRIDNLECAYSTLMGFLASKESEDECNVYCSFNHEEVGSNSNHGAGSTFLEDILYRISPENSLEKLAKSIIVSADNAHAVHPAAVNKTDPTSGAHMNQGIVIKNAANLSYTTDAFSKSILTSIFDDKNILYQDNANNSSVRGGSTLGCISLAHVSITSVDVGLAQLAMHSANETAGTKDYQMMVKGMEEFYNTHILINSNSVKFN